MTQFMKFYNLSFTNVFNKKMFFFLKSCAVGLLKIAEKTMLVELVEYHPSSQYAFE
jgi:hypothetical protein